MPNKALKEAIKRIRVQLKLPEEEPWRHLAVNRAIDVTPRVPDLSGLPPIQEVKRFELPKFEFDDEKLKNMPIAAFPDSIYPPGTRTIPENASMIRGVNEELYSLGYASGIINFKSHFNCKWFQVVYFHPLHYISKIAKSTPAILVSFANNNIFNQEKSINLNDVHNRFYNSAFPFKYATGRHKVKKLMKEEIFNIYNRDPKLFTEYGGVYKFTNKLYPKTQEDIDDFNNCIRSALDLIFNIPATKLLKEVKDADAKIPWNSVDKVFSKFNVESIKPNFPKEKKMKKTNKKSPNL